MNGIEPTKLVRIDWYVKASPVAKLGKGNITGSNLHHSIESAGNENQDMDGLEKYFQGKRGARDRPQLTLRCHSLTNINEEVCHEG